MARKSNSGGGTGGGIFSGIFGMFGTIVRCDSDDDSIYCTIVKFFNLFMIVLFVIYILSIAYQYLPKIKILKRK